MKKNINEMNPRIKEIKIVFDGIVRRISVPVPIIFGKPVEILTRDQINKQVDKTLK